MTGNIELAEGLFRRFAARHGLTIEVVEGSPVELLMRVPRQSGLAFELDIGLQNEDELNIGFGGFWSCIFPFAEKHQETEIVLNALIEGNARLAIHSQFGAVAKRVLEYRKADVFEPWYTEWIRPMIPFLPYRVAYLSNQHPDPNPLSLMEVEGSQGKKTP